MKLCVFQGTFNPIHNTHINMAKFVQQNYDFKTILFIPAYKPPHKICDQFLTRHRYNMVKLTISQFTGFEISDIEFRNERNSYTYLTILELYKSYEIEGKINFIIGTDAFEKIESWYEADKLKELVHFIVFSRKNELNKFSELKNKGYNFTLATMDFEDVSSSIIRQKIKDNEPTKHLINKETERYIKKNELYKN